MVGFRLWSTPAARRGQTPEFRLSVGRRAGTVPAGPDPFASGPQLSPNSAARTASVTRLDAPSFSISAVICCLTVDGER